MIQNYADSGFSSGNLCADMSRCLSFLVMTPHKEISGKNKGEYNERDDLQTHPNGVIHAIVMHENERAQRDAQKDIENTSDQFRFPRDDEDDRKDK